MASSFTNAPFQATIKCSSCEADVPLTGLGEHICDRSAHAPARTTSNQPTEQTPPSSKLDPSETAQLPKRGTSLRQRRGPPSLKVDSSVPPAVSLRTAPVQSDYPPGRRNLDPREAASIAHELGLPSPGPSSGRKSPGRSRRQKPSTAPRAPPSPELPIAQDCAFPRFPIPKPKRAHTDQEITVKPRSISRAATYDATSTAVNGTSIPTPTSGLSFQMEMSRTSTTQRSQYDSHDDLHSLPSTAPSSPPRSADEMGGSSRPGWDNAPPLPALTPSLSNASQTGTNDSSSSLPGWPSAGRRSPSRSVKSPSPETQEEYSLAPLPRAAPEASSAEYDDSSSGAVPSTTFENLLPADTSLNRTGGFERHARQLSYKSKKPPRLKEVDLLARKDIDSASVKSPTTPTAGGLSRSLTNLFRKRGRSISSKRAPTPDLNSPRMKALEPEPPVVPSRPSGQYGVPDEVSEPLPESFPSRLPPTVPARPDGRFGVSDELADSFRSPSPPQMHYSESQPTIPEFATSAPTQTAERIAARSRTNSHADTLQFDFKFDATASTVHQEGAQPASLRSLHQADTMPEPSVEDDHDDAQATRRASIDSASSYGSVGFSHRTTSSRSSQPHSEDRRSNITQSTTHGESIKPGLDGATQVDPSHVESPYDSPTDPFLHGPRLATVPEHTYDSLVSVPDAPVDRSRGLDGTSALTGPAPTSQPVTSVAPLRPTTPAGTKGRCRGCSQLIRLNQKSVSSADGRLTGRYHKECFACQTCREPFATADFYVHDDQPYCAQHYHEKNDSICRNCGKGIEGEYLESFGNAGRVAKKYHARCLACDMCKIPLNDDYFEYQDKVYCEKDAFRVASGSMSGPRNPYDNAPSRPSPLVREYLTSGEPGTHGRFPERRTTRLMMMI